MDSSGAGQGRTRRLRAGALALLAFFCASASASDVRSGGPYVPTPQPVVEEMLALARVGPEDFVVDLGSGDGRIVLTAAAAYRARGLGIDLDSELIEQSTEEARKRGLSTLVQFRREDALKTPLREATVLTLYLLPELLHALRDRIYTELRPGARVVAHDFRFVDWMPDRTHTVDVAEKYGTAGAWQSTLYLWIVPAKVAGRWRATASDGAEGVLSFSQQFQHVEGHFVRGGERVALHGLRVEGNTIRFRVPDARGTREFSGAVNGDTIDGVVVAEGGTVPWRATRIKATAALQRRP